MGTSDHRAAIDLGGDVDAEDIETPVVPPDRDRRLFQDRVVNDAAIIRLRSELSSTIPEFELLVERTDADGESWVEQGRQFLQNAADALEAGAIDEAWRNLHTANRIEIYGLERLADQSQDDATATDARSELQVRANQVFEEATDKLDGWRHDTVMELLADDTGELREDVTGAELRAACRVLHEHYEGVYLVRSEHQQQFNHLVLMGVLSGFAMFVLSFADRLINSQSGALDWLFAVFLETPFAQGAPDLDAPGFAMFVTIAGVMGAALFGMRSLRTRSESMNIPQQINRLTVTGARAVIGAISALVLYFAVKSPVLVGGFQLQEDPRTAAAVLVVIGFAAGYNERMAPAVVNKVASLTDTPEPPQTTPRSRTDDETTDENPDS